MPRYSTRTSFVGREPELRRLHGFFDAAVAGEATLAFVVGEPGIGKTALCEQLARVVAERGGQALTGHCYEEGSLTLPYLPFVEALRGTVSPANGNTCATNWAFRKRSRRDRCKRRSRQPSPSPLAPRCRW